TDEIWAIAGNGTLVEISILNNGTCLTTTTEIWAVAANGTLIEESVLNNGTYVIDSVLEGIINNGTYVVDNVLQGIINNGTYVIIDVLNNGTYETTDSEIWSVAANGTLLEDIVTDTSPQLGGYLDTNTQNIGSTTDEIENIYITTNSKIYLGTGQEGEVYYDGSKLIIKVN
ncbi:hypothetical protein LCGC14_1627970, partial [marine sediment metagenome]